MTGKQLKDGVGSRAVPLDETAQADERASHSIECEVRRRLLAQSELQFSSLVVRRINDGVCLEGVVETNADPGALDDLVACTAGVQRVLNRLVVRSTGRAPALKG